MVRMQDLVVPVITPFDGNGEVDPLGIRDLFDFLIRAGVQNFYILGTTGEVFLMDKEERKRVTELVVDHVSDKGNVFVHVGSSSTRETCELARHAESLGVAGIGAVTPFYFHVTQREMEQYYLEIARSVSEDLPVYLYNIPGCSTNDLLPRTVANLAEVTNIVGIKNSMPDIFRLSQLIDETPDDFDVLIGADNILLSAILYGAKGSVSGNANVFPEIFLDFYKAMHDRDYERAHTQQILINRIANLLKNGANLAYFKHALLCRGLRPMFTRKPLLDLEEGEKKGLQKDINEIMVNYI